MFQIHEIATHETTMDNGMRTEAIRRVDGATHMASTTIPVIAAATPNG